jgi:hypothetical protein
VVLVGIDRSTKSTADKVVPCGNACGKQKLSFNIHKTLPIEIAKAFKWSANALQRNSFRCNSLKFCCGAFARILKLFEVGIQEF